MGKKDFLLGNRTYNKHYEKVKSAKFIGDEFFDPMDIVQVKYEMLKEVMKDGKAVSNAAYDYGFSRTAYYGIKAAFDKQGVSGLAPEKPGPKKPHKMTPEYQTQIDDYLARQPGISSGEIAESLSKDSSITVSKRTIERYRAKKKHY